MREACELLGFAPKWYPPEDLVGFVVPGGKYILACLLWELYGNDAKTFVDMFHAGCILKVDWIIETRRWPTTQFQLDQLEKEFSEPGQMMFIRRLAMDSSQVYQLVRDWPDDVGRSIF